jgi:hypothetical protein
MAVEQKYTKGLQVLKTKKIQQVWHVVLDEGTENENCHQPDCQQFPPVGQARNIV